MTRRTQLAALATLGLVAAVIPVAQAQSSSATDAAHARSSAPSLFGAAPAAAARQSADTSAGAVKRSRYVGFKSSLLRSSARGDELDLPFFDDVDLTATVDHVDEQKLFTSWSGPLDSQYGTFVATKTGNIYSVTANTAGGTYTMTRTGAGAYQVAEVATPDIADIDEPAAPPAGASKGQAQAAAPAAPQPTSSSAKLAHVAKRSTVGDDGSVEDILVAYTAAAAAGYGGVAGIQAEAAKNIAYTNAAYANSGIPLTARLVGVVPVSGTETGGSLDADLDAFSAAGDGKFDEIFGLIAQYHADDTLLLERPFNGDSYCGRGWQQGYKGQAFVQKYALAVLLTGSCTNGFWTFPHELGHNQSNVHDRYTLSTAGPGSGPAYPLYPYGYGYVAPNNAFYTVMAYSRQCQGKGNCTPLLYFSNPAVSYGGQPTGVADANNEALAITSTRPSLASLQQSQLYPTAVKIKGKVQPGRRVHAKFQKWINQGVTYQYTWYRNGKPIKKATKKRYKITRHDIGKKLTVLITGSASYYAPVAVGSEARKVKGQKPHRKGKHHKPGKHHHKGKHHKGHRTTATGSTAQ